MIQTLLSKQRILNSIERSMSSKYDSNFITKDLNYNQYNVVIRRKFKVHYQSKGSQIQ